MKLLPTEPIGSIPRPDYLLEAFTLHEEGRLNEKELQHCIQSATLETLAAFSETGSPVLSDGEQGKYHNFATYCVHGAHNLSPDGFQLKFEAHIRKWPRLTEGPFRYRRHAEDQLRLAREHSPLPVKQAVISPSAMSLFYPADDLPDYPRDAFVADVLSEHEAEVRACLAGGAHVVQVDFTEGRLAYKLDPTGALLNSFIHLNNLALDRFSVVDRARIGVHTCPGGDRDSTHSADVDYAELLPSLFELQASRFYIALAREADRTHALSLIKTHLKPWQTAFVGVIDPLDPRVETPDEVCERILEAAAYIPLDQLGTTDDCGFAPFCDDRSTSRETAFAKIRARVEGTRLASERLFARQ